MQVTRKSFESLMRGFTNIKVESPIMIGSFAIVILTLEEATDVCNTFESKVKFFAATPLEVGWGSMMTFRS